MSPAPRAVPADPAFRLALLVAAAATIFRYAWLGGHPIDLYPDEAQYWIWAQTPAWGYYSKPPMVAWLIAGTTALFGDGDLAVKASAPILYFATSLVVFALAARLYDRQVAAWSAIAFITLPAVSLSSVIISTDVPLLFCWALATLGLVRAREAGGGRWWMLVGIAGGFGLLSKYAMGFWLGSALGFLVVLPDERRHLKGFFGAVALALAIYAPNILWNAGHGFVSYLHTRDNANVHGFALHPLDLAKFALSQFGVFGPAFMATLIFVLARGRRTFADRRQTLLLAFTLPTLGVMLIVALLSRAQPNWAAPVYVTATVLVVAWLSARGREAWVQWSVVLHIVAVVLLFGARDLTHLAGLELPGKFDPLHRVRGWSRLGEALSPIAQAHTGVPLLGDDRETMAALIRYIEPHPFDMRAWNPSGAVHNGFEIDNSLADGAEGGYLYLSGRDETARAEVTRHFAHTEPVGHVMVRVGPGLFREIWAYDLSGFRGYAGSP
jgi:hypothetical protein